MANNTEIEKDIHPKMYMYRRIVEAKNYIDINYSKRIDLNEIANQAAFSKFHFMRLFKQAFGQSPHRYLTRVRLNEAKKLLSDKASVSEACYGVGFESIPSFSSLFKGEYGISPKTYSLQIKKEAELKKQKPLHYIPGCFAQNMDITK